MVTRHPASASAAPHRSSSRCRASATSIRAARLGDDLLKPVREQPVAQAPEVGVPAGRAAARVAPAPFGVSISSR